MALRRALVWVLVFGLVGCGGGGDGRSPAPDSPPAADAHQSNRPTLKKVTHADAMAVVRRSDASITVVNFWATWCVPCVEEFPSFVRLDEQLDDRGGDVLFISTDFPNKKEQVVDFLAQQGVTGTSYLKTGKTTAFVNGFSEEWSGAVPATFIYDSSGTLLDFWEGKVSYEELRERVNEHLESV
jgi:thiol-disulfide isomerase/thioredoxin